MRLTINREELIKGVATVSKAINSKTVNPILQNIKIDMNEKGLELIGTDNDLSINTVIPYMIEEKQIIRNSKKGTTLVSCRLFHEILRHLEGEEVTLELIDNSLLKIEDDKSNFKLNTESDDRYPDIDFSLSGAQLDINAKDFASLVDATAFAASTKEARPLLTAVNLTAKDNVLTAVSTDTARLARKKIEIESDVHFSANIPSRKLVEITRSLDGVDNLTICVDGKKIIFAYDNTIVSSRLIVGDYPSTANIVPKTFNYELEVNAREFVQTVERVSLLSPEHEGVVKLILTEDEAELISRSSMVGSANEKLSTFRFNGERLEINFRASYVTDAIRAINSEDVTIKFIGEMKPFVVKNVKDDSIDMLITPLRS